MNGDDPYGDDPYYTIYDADVGLPHDFSLATAAPLSGAGSDPNFAGFLDSGGFVDTTTGRPPEGAGGNMIRVYLINADGSVESGLPAPGPAPGGKDYRHFNSVDELMQFSAANSELVYQAASLDEVNAIDNQGKVIAGSPPTPGAHWPWWYWAAAGYLLYRIVWR